MDDHKCRGPVKKTPLPTVVLLISVAMATGMTLPNDKNCLSQGGMCVNAGSCPEGNVVAGNNEEALCVSKDRPAECCNSVPTDVETCHQQGGRCGNVDDCQNVPKFGQMDCEQGTNCCLLIY